MKNQNHVAVLPRVMLQAATAADLMTANPVSLDIDSLVKEAVAFLTDKGFSAAPVIDEAGRPVGVLSQSDIVAYDRGKVDYVSAKAQYYEQVDLRANHATKRREGFEVVDVDRTRVRDIMTPVVYSVKPGTPAYNVIEDMLGRKVHRLFVVDDDGVLVGVVSAFDVLRHLSPE